MATGKYKKWQQPENLILIQGWRRDGLSDEQVAQNMGISRKTLYEWIKKYSDIGDAYKKGSEVSSYEVENASFKAANGYFVEEAEMIETTGPDGVPVKTKKIHRRWVPPSTAMQIFILKNRLPDKYKDSRMIETKNDGQLAALIDGLKEPEKKDE